MRGDKKKAEALRKKLRR